MLGLVFLLALAYGCLVNYGALGRLAPGDSAKFACIMLEGGVPHTPFFPLYTLLLRFWGHVAIIFNPVAQGGLLSALLVAFGLAFLWDFLRRRYGLCLLPWLLALVMGCLPFFFLAATEITPVSLSIFLFFLLLDVFDSEAPVWLKTGLMGLLAFHDPLGLWFAVLLWPCLFVFCCRKGKVLEFILGTLLAFVLGLMPYAYVIREFNLGHPREYLEKGKLARTLALGILNGQFFANYFQYPAETALARIPEILTGCFGGFIKGFFVSCLLLGLCLAKKLRSALCFAGFYLLALFATLLFLAPSFHYYMKQWFWLLQAMNLVALALALMNIASTASPFRPFFLPLFFLSLVLVPLESLPKWEKGLDSYSATRQAHAFGTLPSNCLLLTEDIYETTACLKYHRTYMPLMTPAGIAVGDSPQKGRMNFFWSDKIKEACDQQGIGYTLYRTVEGLDIYCLGSKSKP